MGLDREPDGVRRERADRTFTTGRKPKPPVKRTTEAMHRGLGRAVAELRARMRWGQVDLAHHISRHGSRVGLTLAPAQEMISRWERCEQAPSPVYRTALAKLAAEYGHDDLAELFRAPISAWWLVGYVKLGPREVTEPRGEGGR